jgi:hypothetical protein
MMTTVTAQKAIWRVLAWIGGRVSRRRRRVAEGIRESGEESVGRGGVAIGNLIGVLIIGRGAGVGKGTVIDIDGTTGIKSKI